MIRRKYLDSKKEKENTNKYNFQGQSTRSILGQEWSKEIFSTRETGFYKHFIKNILNVKRQKHINYL